MSRTVRGFVCIACFAFGAWAAAVTAMAPSDHRVSGCDLGHELPSSELPPAPLSESEEHEIDDGDGDGDAIVAADSPRLSGSRWGRALAACTAPVQCQYQGPHVKPPTPPPRG